MLNLNHLKLIIVAYFLLALPLSAQGDVDNDRLIEITTLAQLNVIRYDFDGLANGTPSGTAAEEAAYRMAFNLAPGVNNTCTNGCQGYELINDLDFNDADGAGAGTTASVWAAPTAPNQADSPVSGGWVPIGNNYNSAFRAHFEGNRHTISNLYINTTTLNRIGLFGTLGNVGSDGEIRNLGLEGGSVTGRSAYAGGLVGRSHTGTLIANYSTVDVTGTADARVGGLVGESNVSTISACYATGDVTGGQSAYVGGLVGYNNSSTISACYATGSARGGNSTSVGGLIGLNYISTISACYATGSARGGSGAHVGGLVGYHFLNGTISACYSTGSARGENGAEVGGLVGLSQYAPITNSYFDKETSTLIVSGSELAAKRGIGNEASSIDIGKTTSALQFPTAYGTGGSLYENWNVDIGGTSDADDPWDFVGNNRYPKLRVDFDGDGMSATAAEFGVQRFYFTKADPGIEVFSLSVLDEAVASTIIGYAKALLGTTTWALTDANFEIDSGTGVITVKVAGATVATKMLSIEATVESVTTELNLNVEVTASPPTITITRFEYAGATLSPATAVRGATVKIIGTNFSTSRTNNTITVGGATARILSATATELVFAVPAGATLGLGRIRVTVSGAANDVEEAFTITLPSPTITRFEDAAAGTITSALIGATVKIIGTKFSTTPANNTITVGSATAPPTSATATVLTFTVPAGASPGSGKIRVTVSGAANYVEEDFTITLPSPTITEFQDTSGATLSPATAVRGATVKIIGTNFSTTEANNTITVGGATATLTNATATVLTFTVPLTATLRSGQILRVTVLDAENYVEEAFEVTAPPLAFAAASESYVTLVSATDLAGSGDETIPSYTLSRTTSELGSPAVVILTVNAGSGSTYSFVADYMGADPTTTTTTELSIVEDTGVISTTATAIVTDKTFYVKATRDGSFVVSKVVLTVTAPPPPALAFAEASTLDTDVAFTGAGAEKAKYVVTKTLDEVDESGDVVLILNVSPSVTTAYAYVDEGGTSIPPPSGLASTINTNGEITTDGTLAVTSAAVFYVQATQGGNTVIAKVELTVNAPPQGDADNNQLIEIATLAQLNAIRYDLDGNGTPSGTAAEEAAYRMAFNLSPGVNNTCTDGCEGYELMNDLDFKNGSAPASAFSIWAEGSTASGFISTGWEPIGDNSSPFNTTFEGNRRTISNLYINTTTLVRVGLFGRLGSGVQIRNLGLEGGSVSSTALRAQVGSLAGESNASTIRACYAIGSASATGDYAQVGGLVGYSTATISACYTTGDVTGGNAYVGGLVGRNSAERVSACYSTGDVTGGDYASVGGLVGYNSSGKRIISTCYATGDVTGGNSARAGGLVGSNSGTISACYATGSARGGTSAKVGGLVGQDISGTISNSYFDSQISMISNGIGDGDDAPGTALAKTTSELQSPEDYTAIYSAWNMDIDDADADADLATGVDDPWDFVGNNRYPRLKVDFDGDSRPTATEFGPQHDVPLPSPTITRFEDTGGTPITSALIGDIVKIIGMNFSTTPANNTITVGSATAPPTSATATELTFTVPAGASPGSVQIRVTVSGAANYVEEAFTITLPSPTITRFEDAGGTITSALRGATVKIIGMNFSTTLTNNTITVGSATATLTSATADELTFTVPAGASPGSVQIRVTVSGAANSVEEAFTITAPPPPPPPPPPLAFAAASESYVTLVSATDLAGSGDETIPSYTLSRTTSELGSPAVVILTVNAGSGSTYSFVADYMGADPTTTTTTELSIVEDTGVISTTATAIVTDKTFYVKATRDGSSVVSKVVLTVTAPPPPPPPPPPLAFAAASESYVTLVSATDLAGSGDETIPSYTLSRTTSELGSPAVVILTVNAGSGSTYSFVADYMGADPTTTTTTELSIVEDTGVISTTATAIVTDKTFYVKATRDGSSVVSKVVLTVTAPPPPPPPPLAFAAASESYVTLVSATDLAGSGDETIPSYTLSRTTSELGSPAVVILTVNAGSGSTYSFVADYMGADPTTTTTELSIVEDTGVISTTATAIVTDKTFYVKATRDGSSVVSKVVLTVTAPPPPALAFAAASTTDADVAFTGVSGDTKAKYVVTKTLDEVDESGDVVLTLNVDPSVTTTYAYVDMDGADADAPTGLVSPIPASGAISTTAALAATSSATVFYVKATRDGASVIAKVELTVNAPLAFAAASESYVTLVSATDLAGSGDETIPSYTLSRTTSELGSPAVVILTVNAGSGSTYSFVADYMGADPTTTTTELSIVEDTGVISTTATAIVTDKTFYVKATRDGSSVVSKVVLTVTAPPPPPPALAFAEASTSDTDVAFTGASSTEKAKYVVTKTLDEVDESGDVVLTLNVDPSVTTAYAYVDMAGADADAPTGLVSPIPASGAISTTAALAVTSSATVFYVQATQGGNTVIAKVELSVKPIVFVAPDPPDTDVVFTGVSGTEKAKYVVTKTLDEVDASGDVVLTLNVDPSGTTAYAYVDMAGADADAPTGLVSPIPASGAISTTAALAVTSSATVFYVQATQGGNTVIAKVELSVKPIVFVAPDPPDTDVVFTGVSGTEKAKYVVTKTLDEVDASGDVVLTLNVDPSGTTAYAYVDMDGDPMLPPPSGLASTINTNGEITTDGTLAVTSMATVFYVQATQGGNTVIAKVELSVKPIVFVAPDPPDTDVVFTGVSGTEKAKYVVTKTLDEVDASGDVVLTLNVDPSGTTAYAYVDMDGAPMLPPPSGLASTINTNGTISTDAALAVTSMATVFYVQATQGGNTAIAKVELTVNAAATTDFLGLTNLAHDLVSLYPNPASDRVYVSGLKSGDVYIYEIYSFLGQKVGTGQLSEGPSIDLEGLSAGAYVLILRSESGEEVFRSRCLISK